jgi:site-specific DNA-methyltransferase (adenine-specific)
VEAGGKLEVSGVISAPILCFGETGALDLSFQIGNPPYNEELKTKKGSATALYNKFVEYYIEKCNLLCFVIPSRWFSGGKGLDSFRKNMLGRNDIVYIKHFNDASTIFGNSVSIEGGVNYFLKDIHHKGDCKFNGSNTKLKKYDVFVDSKNYSIIDKIVKFNSITTLFIGQSYSGVNSNDRRLKDIETSTTLKCYVSQQKGFEKYIEKKEINKDRDFNKWKVITAEANGGKGCFGNMFVGKPNEICNQSYVLFEVKNEEEAKSLLTYLKCRLPNFMLSLRKTSQHICESTCKWIPLPPLNKVWTDAEVYKYFKLSTDEIKLINEANIIGYKNIIKKSEGIVETKKNSPIVADEVFDTNNISTFTLKKLKEIAKLNKIKNYSKYTSKNKNELIEIIKTTLKNNS